MKASDIARLIGAELEGGVDPDITGAAPLDRAEPGDLSLLTLARYAPLLESSSAGLLLVAPKLADRVPAERPHIVLQDVQAALVKLLPRLYPEQVERAEPGIHPSAVIADGALLGDDVTVGPGAVVEAGSRIGVRVRIGANTVVGEQCVVGDGVVLHPHVTVYPRTVIGAHTIVHAGARLGSDGYGYVDVGGVPGKIPQVGACVIGANVEIGANVAIDRGSIGTTEIGDYVKIDNLVHIAHNVRIGAGSMITAQVGFAGSTQVGRGTQFGGQAGIAGHVEIGDGATIAGQAGVFGSVPPGEVWSGYPARPHREALRAQANLARLDGLRERVRRLEEQLEGRPTE